MTFFEDISPTAPIPRLIPSFKQTERKLLSVFLALLRISPEIRGAFFEMCGFRGGRTSKFKAFMEVTFNGSKYPDTRPDGLLHCERGQTNWSLLVEAKADGSQIRSDQIHAYAELAKLTGTNGILTISNEFARLPHEVPYHLDSKKVRNLDVFHFAWADIRTFLELQRENQKLGNTEISVLDECLDFFWDEKSGIRTYDAMPEQWAAFVEASSTALGFNANVKGLTEIVQGWQQERRDLCSKLTHMCGSGVEIRHKAGVRSTEAERTKVDKTDLANDYSLEARYFFKQTKLELDVILSLNECRMSAVLDLPFPDNKGAKALTTWVSRLVSDEGLETCSICFDWRGKNNDKTLSIPQFLAEPTFVSDGATTPPKKIKLVASRHSVRNFKSRKKVVADLEEMTLHLASFAKAQGWV